MSNSKQKDLIREKLGNIVYSFNEPVIKNFNTHMDDYMKSITDSDEAQSTINGILDKYVDENIISDDAKVIAKILIEGGISLGVQISILQVLANQDLFAQRALNKAFNKINEILVKRNKPINIV